MADMRGILDDHVAKVAWRDGGPIVRCEGDGLEFGTMEEFGEHVDRLLAFPPRSRTEAVCDTLSLHLGDPDPLGEEAFEVSVDDHGRIRCGCGWTGHGPVDGGEWRRHLTDAILEALGKVE